MATSLEALLRSVGADLQTYHEVGMALPDTDLQRLVSSITDRIPEPSCPLQLADITRAIASWQAAGRLSDDASAGLRSRMVSALVDANKSRAAAEAAALSVAPLDAAVSGAQSVTAGSEGGVQATSGSKKGSGSATLRAPPGLEPGQQSIVNMLGAKTITRTLKASDGSKYQQEL